VVLGEDKKKFKTRSGDTVRLVDLLVMIWFENYFSWLRILKLTSDIFSNFMAPTYNDVDYLRWYWVGVMFIFCHLVESTTTSTPLIALSHKK
jgi:hypothetical protein